MDSGKMPNEDDVVLNESLNEQDEVADYLDYLLIQAIKTRDEKRLSLAEVKAALELEG
ncbi:protein of unknown function [Candidatus Promineifilum breve]|uniref:Uncharacterized protein n=1 Tax=Candidatus Promineifilum breve TaxID=1806508 RepID=A0A160T0P3_9CHLR|nr:hypothetical protein [Candidatus Promineifilum breve]CUS01890.2 protein of unknown function [Candidatus Promineifilum breve]